MSDILHPGSNIRSTLMLATCGLIAIAATLLTDNAAAGVLAECPAVAGDGIHDDSRALSDCIASRPNGATLALPPGRYLIARPLEINRGNITITTRGLLGSAIVCGRDSGTACARLVAAPNLIDSDSADTLRVDNGHNLTLDHIIIDGNRAARKSAGYFGVRTDGTRDGAFGRNVMFNTGDNVTISNSAFINALCMTSLGIGNDFQRPMKNLRFIRNYVANNGRRGTSDADIWADGLTVGMVTDSEFSDNEFLDNSDVDFILGGAPRTRVLRNTIRHVSGYAFAAFMLTNFELYRPAPRLADFRGLNVSNLTINCGSRCDIAVQVGVFPWGYDSNWQKYLTMGGEFRDINISTAKQGINVAGGGSSGAPVTFARFSVTGAPAIQASPQYLLGAFQGRRASHFNVTGPGLYSNVTFPEGGSEVTNDDWRLGYILNQDHVGGGSSGSPSTDFYAPLAQIRALSTQYFGQASASNEAVTRQLQFLSQGGTLAQLEANFAAIRSAWITATGSTPPAYAWVDVEMTFLLDGGTPAQLLSILQSAFPQADAQMPPPDNTLSPFYAPLPQVRYLSTKYFGRPSANTEAVVLQLQFLSGGGTLQQLESYFTIVKRVWTNVKGTPNPAYGWVDAGMTFLINGGTEAQYSEAVRAVVF